MNILRLDTNTPVQAALKFDGGRDVDGRYRPQGLYILADGRLMYLEPRTACRINELKITAGEPFYLQARGQEWPQRLSEKRATEACCGLAR